MQDPLAFQMEKELNLVSLKIFRLALPGPQISISESFEFDTGFWLCRLVSFTRFCLSWTFTHHSWNWPVVRQR